MSDLSVSAPEPVRPVVVTPAAPPAPMPSPSSLLELLMKVWPVLVALGCAAYWAISAAFGQQISSARYDTLVQERGARNQETREMVIELRKDFEASEKTNAKFQGETTASLTAIKDALQIERDDRKDKSH